MGNQFLDDLRQADVLIHIVDASGALDSEGQDRCGGLLMETVPDIGTLPVPTMNAAGVSTNELIRRYQAGQTDLFDVLFDRHKDYVYRVAYSITRHPQEAEEVVQETFLDVLKALPRLTKRVFQTVAAGRAAKPDVIVIIDAPEFTHRVARRLRRSLPLTPIIDYVCPSVWAWRPGRARC